MTKQELNEKWDTEILDEVIHKKNLILNFLHDHLIFKDIMTAVMLIVDYEESLKKMYKNEK